MKPYSSPTLPDFDTLTQSKLLKNQNLHSGKFLYTPYLAVKTQSPTLGVVYITTGMWCQHIFHLFKLVSVSIKSVNNESYLVIDPWVYQGWSNLDKGSFIWELWW